MLEQALSLYQFKFDVDVELQWIKEKLPTVSSQHIGDSLTEVTNLHKKHEVTMYFLVTIAQF